MSDKNPIKNTPRGHETGQRTQVSLGWELIELQHVAEGGRILADSVVNQSYDTERDAKVIPAAVSALLSLLACRLETVRRVVQGAADPRGLLAAHNAIEARPGIADPEDILLVWSDDRRREHLQAELGQAERRLRDARPARKAKRKGTRKRGAA